MRAGTLTISKRSCPIWDDQNRLLPESWPATARKDSQAYDALETLLKGLEITLPNRLEFRDKDNHPRTNIRTRWWDNKGITYRDLAMVPPEVIEKIPHEPIPEDILPGYDAKKPVFVGHYWMTGEPAPLTDHIACLDYSVAKGPGGKLCAYRFDGGQTLSQANFVWVSV